MPDSAAAATAAAAALNASTVAAQAALTASELRLEIALLKHTSTMQTDSIVHIRKEQKKQGDAITVLQRISAVGAAVVAIFAWVVSSWESIGRMVK